jgi:hypothetical protein
VATVEVNDGHDHVVNGSASGEGTLYVPALNSPPAVTISFPNGSTCTPQKGAPCSLLVVAEGSDADDDPLRYSWSGCAGGTGPRADCIISSPGPVVATVAADDGQHVVKASATATGAGTNSPPRLQVGYITRLPASTTINVLGNVIDPDDGFLCGAQYCRGMTSSGACRGNYLDCTCLGGLETEVIPTATAGSCTLTFSLVDGWGAVGTPTITIDIATLKILSQSGTTLSSRTPR